MNEAVSLSLDRPPVTRADEIASTIETTCLRHVSGRNLVGRLLRQSCGEIRHLPASDNVVIVCHPRRTTGITVHAYVMSRRVERARRLLPDRRLTLAEIAFRCGFASRSHFTTVFRTALGVTPGHYRRMGVP